MFKLRRVYLYIILFISTSTFAQQSSRKDLNQAYQNGLDLFKQHKYVAAAAQFKRVEQKAESTAQEITEAGTNRLIKENASFYRGVCALELENTDAESLLIQFITENPGNSLIYSAYYHLGRFYFSKKNYVKSISWFKKAEGNYFNEENSLEYRFKLAYAYFETKDFASAEPLFGQLKDISSKYREEAIYYYAYISYLNADYQTALKEFERLKGSKTYEESYPYYISALYFLDGRYPEVIAYAIPNLKTIQAKYETEMFRIIAASYFARADYAQASVYYQNFQDKDQKATQNNQDAYQIGYTALQLKDYKKAITELETLGTADEFFQSGMIALGKSFLAIDDKQGARNAFFRASKLNYDKEMQEEGAFNYAKLSYELEFHQVALDATQEFISNFSSSKRLNEAKILLSEILLTTKNYKDAIDILESISNRNKEAQEVYQKVTYYRGLEYFNERAFQNAISAFLRSNRSAIDPEIASLATYWMAESMYEVRKYGEAIEKFQSFLSMPQSKQSKLYNFAYYALAYAYFEDENYYKSATYLEQFLRGSDIDLNTRIDATLRLADSYFVVKNYTSALVNYQKIISEAGSGHDYALFQQGMIQGLQGLNEEKIATHQLLLQLFPGSNYADDAGFEIAYTYFIKGEFDRSKADLSALIEKYPRSSYVPRALVTIGLVQYNQDNDDAALETFKKVISDYQVTDEAQQALESIRNIYMDRADAEGFLNYANSTNIGNYSLAEQDNLIFQAANKRFLSGDFSGTIDAVYAYFDKFPKAIHTKQARFIRAESLVKTGKPDQAIPDYEYILNDWTSDYTERALISISKIYLNQKKYNEAIVHLKKLELTSEYRANYGFALNNLMEAYANLNMPDETLKYVDLLKGFEKSSEEDKLRAQLFAGKAYLLKNNQPAALKEFEEVNKNTQTILAAEARYLIAEIQFSNAQYTESQQTAFDLINNLPSYDYWVAKSFLLLADTYLAQKDLFQAKSTLQSLIDNYTGDDDILPKAKEKLDALNKSN
ncbi:MAG: hypothetical protein RI924_190 [Bacteroidota bacterium]|jgi:TolA-binding protein